MQIDKTKIQVLKEGEIKKLPVVYWMQRDQRVNDNWALLYAQDKAVENGVPLYVVFSLVSEFSNAGLRHYHFLLKGLQKVETELAKLNISLIVLKGNPSETIISFLKETEAGVLITDFNPVKVVMEWKEKILHRIKVPFHEVDAHNIVPCRIASAKEEFAAYTIRPKIERLLDRYLVEFPHPLTMKQKYTHNNDWNGIYKQLNANPEVREIKWLLPGEDEALKTLQEFIDVKSEKYADKRNDPAYNVSSNLSPYFHFGQLAPQRAALAIQRLTDNITARDSFLEELIVRRELADNFCFYNRRYDSFEGFKSWAKETLNRHRKDKREYIYSLDDFEKGNTHDKLWNAAQIEMVNKGKMHGYMRMYWAKKILEWSKTPEDAIETAIFLNDKYELDGRDPNGYAGISWSIGGVHDRAWGEREIFGKIRYMNFNGCKRKFDVDLYIEKILNTDEIF